MKIFWYKIFNYVHGMELGSIVVIVFIHKQVGISNVV